MQIAEQHQQNNLYQLKAEVQVIELLQTSRLNTKAILEQVQERVQLHVQQAVQLEVEVK